MDQDNQNQPSTPTGQPQATPQPTVETTTTPVVNENPEAPATQAPAQETQPVSVVQPTKSGGFLEKIAKLFKR